jgi:hypothetical protein
MKKLLIAPAVVLLAMVLFSSCKKSYKCVCEGGNIENIYIKKMSKSEADTERAKCEFNLGCEFKQSK